MVVLSRRVVIFAGLMLLLTISMSSPAAPKTNTAATTKKRVNKPFPPLVAYDKALYLLAYQTFSANNDPKRALDVALAALRAHPDDIDWQRRVANIAAWAGDSVLAMNQFLSLSQNHPSLEDLNQTIQLASAYHNDPILIKALNIKLTGDPDDITARYTWIRAMEREGQANAAATLLQTLSQHSTPHKKFYLTELARLYLRLGYSREEMKTLNILQTQYPPTAQHALRQAEIYFNQGKVEPSLEVMKHVMKDIPASETDYWQTLANLAWMIDERDIALIAYQTLYKTGQASSGEITNMVAIIQEKDPQQAFALGIQAMASHPSPPLFMRLASITEALNTWQSLAQLLDQLPPQQIKALEKNTYFWQLRPYIWYKAGDHTQAIASYQQTIAAFPDSQPLQAAYLWMLIDTHQPTLLKDQVNRLAGQHNLSEALENAYISAAIQSGLPKLAVAAYQRQLETKSDNILFLTHYAYALQASGMASLASRVRQYSWQRLQHKPQPLSHQELLTMASLANHYGRVDQALPILARLVDQYRQPDDMAELLSWALANQHYDLAIYLRNHYYTNETFPRYAAMTLAIIENNRYRLSEQLSQTIRYHTPPSSDDVTAAQRLGHVKLARQLAYQRANANPGSYYDRETLRQLLLLTTNALTINQEYERVGGIEGPATTTQMFWFINSHWQINTKLSTWFIDHRDKSTLAETPSHDSRAEMNLEYQLHPGYSEWRGFVQGTLGYRSAWHDFPFADVYVSYPWHARTTVNIELGYNQETEESSALRIAGARDVLGLSGNYQLTNRQLFILELDGNRYYNQRRNYLGSGVSTTLNWQYLYRKRYPDIILSPFFDAKFYDANGRIDDEDLPLMTADEQVDNTTISSQNSGNTGTGIHFFIPYNLLQWGLTLSLGQSHYVPFNPSGSISEPLRAAYKRPWRPFLNSSLFQDYSQHIVKLGYAFAGGMAGELLGHDNLAAYFNYSFGEEGIDFKFYLIGLQYRYYF